MIIENALERPERDVEAYKTLLARVGRKSPKIPADLLVRHVLGIVPAGEWPVRFEAMEALLRWVESVKKEGLAVASRPAGGAPLGVYSTRKEALGLAAVCDGDLRDRPDRGAVRLPGLPQELAGALRACPGHPRSSP